MKANVRVIKVPPVYRDGICLVERTVLAGTRHVPRIVQLAEGLHAGSCLRLERDSSNPHDPYAVRVLTSCGKLIGYVSCEFNEIVSRLLGGGKHLHASVNSVELVGSWTRIEMAVILDD